MIMAIPYHDNLQWNIYTTHANWYKSQFEGTTAFVMGLG